jgi:hypothetical protein
MSTNPGWSLTGAWAYGTPTGVAGDPSAGFTGANVVGYNLNGAYANNITLAQTATTTAINTLGYRNVNLSFRRWLGVETFTRDRATIQVSNNGTTWTTVYQNPTTNLVDTSWQLVTYNISSVADDKATVFVRWTMGPTNSSVTFAGWNIDDVVVDGQQVIPSVDTYSLNINAAQTPTLDIALAGHGATTFAGQSLQLLDPNGVVVATASSLSQGATNKTASDLEIRGYVPLLSGNYQIRFSSLTPGKYGIVAVAGAAFDATTNDLSTGVLRPLAGANLGYLGTTIDDQAYSLTIDSTNSQLLISGTVSGFGDPNLNPLVPQLPGSLAGTPGGTISFIVSDGTARIASATSIDFLEQAGAVQPNNAPADFSGAVTVAGIPLQAAARGVFASADQVAAALSASGNFSVQGLNFSLTAGTFDYGAGVLSLGTYALPGLSATNVASGEGIISTTPGKIVVTAPVLVEFDTVVPVLGNSINLLLQIAGQVQASQAWGDGSDFYSISLSAGQSVVFETATPLDSAGVGNNLDVAVNIYSAGGTLLTSDDNSAADARNARLLFTAPSAGVYTVQVAGRAGRGEYILNSTLYATPSADAGPPVVILEGQSLQLDASASTGVGTLTYVWDVNGDDIFTDAIGVNPTLSWLDLIALGVTDQTSLNNVRVRVSDAFGGVDTSSPVIVTIDNAAPVASITGPTSALRGEIVSFTLTALDPAPADQAANFTFAIDWDGDAVVDQTVVGPSGIVVTHAFNSLGNIVITVTATDKDAAPSNPVSTSIAIAAWILQPNVDQPSLMDLVWSGTTGADSVAFEQTGAGQITIRETQLNGQVLLVTTVVDGVTGDVRALARRGDDLVSAELLTSKIARLWGDEGNDTLVGSTQDDQLFGDGDGPEGGSDSISGGGGNDLIVADGPEGRTDTISGGDGNDVIIADPDGAEGGNDQIDGGVGDDIIDAGAGNDNVQGGVGDDILIGGSTLIGDSEDNDTLIAGDGRDLLIGGLGGDSLVGGIGEDLLIAGSVDAAFLANSYAGLIAVRDAWRQPDTVTARKDNIEGGPGSTLPPAFVLAPGSSVLDDDAVDRVIANDDGADIDWIFRDLAQDVLAAGPADLLTDI